MGRGNVCVRGPYEGLYHIDNDHIHVYRCSDDYSDWPETQLMGELDIDELLGDEWLYDEEGTMMPLPKPKICTYECKHHRWESWNHYGEKMPENGCDLSKDKFACKYLDASRCPNFEQKEEK